ncbi:MULTISPECIES: hypothetical protein [Streptomyces]|uniref:Uncharacterized protein n=2 Tax=Streptomyces griseus TaxID=1911 RepID=A2V7M4_STRGR|nr:hypothetical protein [Streptomyces griseus]BAF46970.1 hypothetical protein [Streptomyces griseus] [Streptomyces griseus subsp. griseus NBRC 13350]BAG19381.1 hypothetical protein SGR_2552 [Streptomyces griseus subsp. griseus NBRC 13350]SEE90931.1 hypothetical protein SAMN04490359_6981 [Streptomyces griseus]SQA23808.1 Uncharacterised protein [Streptomyces griseus]
MSLFRKPQPLAVHVLRDAPELVAGLRRALESATDSDRPGLERALALAEDAAARPDAELRGRWVRQRLTAAGHEGPADSVEAIKILRRAEPGLTLLQAVTYAKEAKETEASEGGEGAAA